MSPTTSHRRPSLIVTATVTALGLGALAWATTAGGARDRQQIVAERGAQVMSFDLDATTHRYAAAPDGGLQTVTADDPGDDAQVRLVQSHLQEEAEAFARGGFGDPASIHGADMPGLATLQAAAGSIDFRYGSRGDSAEIRYVTTDPAVVDALHDWFAAQTSDHGDHAG